MNGSSADSSKASRCPRGSSQSVGQRSKLNGSQLFTRNAPRVTSRDDPSLATSYSKATRLPPTELDGETDTASFGMPLMRTSCGAGWLTLHVPSVGALELLPGSSTY